MSRLLPCLLLLVVTTATVAGDARVQVDLPPMMRDHMLGNMRDHLEVIDTLLGQLAAGAHDQAAELAETRLGMSSLGRHGAEHMAPHMPEGMRAIGSSMHRAASRFARVVVEGDAAATLAALREVTAACTACHRGYRVH